MKAIVLAGGRGTRLRPLTLTVTKPLIEFCNKPILEYQIRSAIEAGINHIIFATSVISNQIKHTIENLKQKDTPLGTAGPLKLAENLIMDPEDKCENILIFNADIICNYPLNCLISAHIAKDADITILATSVDNPSSFGVIQHNEDMKISSFVEKPTEYIGNLINAGIYVMNKRVIADIPLKNISIERFLFPKLVEKNKLYCHKSEGLWSDVGTPKDYLTTQELYIKLLSENFQDENYLHSTSFGNLISTNDSNEIKFDVIPPILIHPNATIGKGCKIGPNVCISNNVIIGEGCRIQNSSIMSDAIIGNYCFIEGTILGWSCKLNNWSHIEGLSVFGEEVEVGESLVVRGSYILPHKLVSESIYQIGAIIM